MPRRSTLAREHPDRPLIVALTGTDLYRDLLGRRRPRSLARPRPTGSSCCRRAAPASLPAAMRGQSATSCYQSARALVPLAAQAHRIVRLRAGRRPSARRKGPCDRFRARRAAPSATLAMRRSRIGGAALDPALGRAARDLAAVDARRYAGSAACAHGETRAGDPSARTLLVHPSADGGRRQRDRRSGHVRHAGDRARMSGNVGMLGADYPGLFPVGDDGELAALADSGEPRRPRVPARSLSGASARRRAPPVRPRRAKRATHRLVATRWRSPDDSGMLALADPRSTWQRSTRR